MRLIDADNFVEGLNLLINDKESNEAVKQFAKNVIAVVNMQPTVPIFNIVMDQLMLKSIDCDSESGVAFDFIDIVEAFTNKEFAQKVLVEMKNKDIMKGKEINGK